MREENRQVEEPASDRSIRVWFWTPDPGFAHLITKTLGSGFELRCSSGSEADHILTQADWCDVALLDFRPSEGNGTPEPGLEAMKAIGSTPLPPPVIVLLSDDGPESSLRMIEWGAFDTVHSPPNVLELRLILRRAFKFRQLESRLQELTGPTSSQLFDLVGTSPPMQRIFGLVQTVAPCDVTALISGETGTGKELLARAIHRLSPRANHPFVGFSCACLPETLIEDELFGHEKGAFTGALMARRGRLEAADKGTLFLDEIGDLDMGLQAKLLRVLQERTFERLGSNATISADFRLICATNRDVPELVKQGKFREDLYYRLNVIQLSVPPLRERPEDIPYLAQHFMQKFARQFGKKTKRFSFLTTQALEEHSWPGNVRELENVVQRAVVMAEGSTIEVHHLPPALRKGFERQLPAHSYEDAVREFKRRLIVRTLRESGWCKQDAARSLGLARSYLHRLIAQLQIPAEGEDLAVVDLPEALTKQIM
ncbi:MAG: sigma 54-interacting transcriptional regulator [Candidatus Acidiferrales bacterium]